MVTRRAFLDLTAATGFPYFTGHLGSDYAHPIVLAKPAIFEF